MRHRKPTLYLELQLREGIRRVDHAFNTLNRHRTRGRVVERAHLLLMLVWVVVAAVCIDQTTADGGDPR